MQVSQLMTTPVLSVESSATLVEAAGMMRDADTGALPVLEGGRPIGMLTDRDIVVRAIAAEKDPIQTTVREVITPRVTTIYDDQEVEEAAKLMADDQVRRLLVISRDQRPLGVLSLGDLARSESAQREGAKALQGTSESEHDHTWQNAKHP
jgi:CBS domain-containing protein